MREADYEILYDLPAGEYDRKAVGGIRTVTVRAGRSLEVMCHPIVNFTPAMKREAKERKTRPSAQAINHRNTERHMMRMIEHNFTERAFVATLTYAYPAEDYGLCNLEDMQARYAELALPEHMDDVRRHIRNFLGRLKRIVKRGGGDPRRVKWLFMIEEGKEPPMGGLPPKYHAHGVVEAEGLTREEIEACWEKHGRTRCDRLDLRNDGPMRLARYINKNKRCGRWWSHSRNLKCPAPRVSDRKISRRRAALMAEDIRRNGKEILEKLYPGYKLVELPDPTYSDFVPGVYIYARMRRRD